MKVVKQDSEPAKNKSTEIFAEPLANDVEPAVLTTSSTPTSRLSRWRFFVGVGVYCVVIVVGGKYLISKVGHHNTKTQVVPNQVNRNINTTGKVVPQELLSVLPQATDLRIKQVLVKEGDRVKAGQLMAVFDDSVLQELIDQARELLKSSEAIVIQKQAGVLQAKADIGKAKAVLVKTQAQASESKAQMVKAEAQLGEALANLAKAKSERNRYQFLAGEGEISVQDLESSSTDATAFEELRSAKAEIERVQAEFDSVQAEVDSYRAGVSAAQANLSNAQADLKSAEANVNSSKAQIQQLQTARSRTLLRAPANGLVMERIAQVGDVTSFDRKLFSLVRDSSFVLQVKLEEYQLPLRIGTPVLVTSDSDKRIRLQGKVREISPVVDSQTYQPIVRIDLPPSTLLRSGMVLRATIASANPNKPKLTNSK